MAYTHVQCEPWKHQTSSIGLELVHDSLGWQDDMLWAFLDADLPTVVVPRPLGWALFSDLTVRQVGSVLVPEIGRNRRRVRAAG